VYLDEQSNFGTPEKKSAKVDLSALFTPRSLPMTGAECDDLMDYYNGILRMMQCCIIENKKFSILPQTERGWIDHHSLYQCGSVHLSIHRSFL
jgi:hypothetical protein